MYLTFPILEYRNNSKVLKNEEKWSAPVYHSDKKTRAETHEQLKSEDVLMSWEYNDWKWQWDENRTTVLPLDPKIMEINKIKGASVHMNPRNGCTLQRISYDSGKIRVAQPNTFTTRRMNISRAKREDKQILLT